jgi:hypothetical protein
VAAPSLYRPAPAGRVGSAANASRRRAAAALPDAINSAKRRSGAMPTFPQSGFPQVSGFVSPTTAG